MHLRKKTVFSNGLTLLTERTEGHRSLSLGVWVKVGTRHESTSEAGISHFLEHMLFKGTKKRSALQIAREIDQVGGEFNAFTAREHTCFHLLILDRDWELGIDILTDVLVNSQFKKDEFERERSVILQEIAMVDESPEELAHDLYYELIFGNHALGRPILGTKKSIKKLGRTDVVKFFERYYRPEEIVFSVAGDLSHAQVKKKLETLIGGTWRPRKAVEPSAPILPVMKPGFWWSERATEQVHLIWGVPGPHYASQDRFAAFLLNVYLGGGMSSALFQEIREKKGAAYTVYSNLTPYQDTGVFSIYVGTRIEQVSLCLKLIEEAVDGLKAKLLPIKELKMIQDNLKGTLLLAADHVESRMCSIARNEISLGKNVTVQEACDQIDRVTPSDIKRLARQLFKTENRSILAMGPKPKPKVYNKMLSEGVQFLEK